VKGTCHHIQHVLPANVVLNVPPSTQQNVLVAFEELERLVRARRLFMEPFRGVVVRDPIACAVDSEIRQGKLGKSSRNVDKTVKDGQPGRNAELAVVRLWVGMKLQFNCRIFRVFSFIGVGKGKACLYQRVPGDPVVWNARGTIACRALPANSAAYEGLDSGEIQSMGHNRTAPAMGKSAEKKLEVWEPYRST
jgi:hypothetical protein